MEGEGDIGKGMCYVVVQFFMCIFVCMSIFCRN